MKKLIPLFLLPIVSYSATIINGGFETGDLTGWTFTGETENSFNSRVEGGEFTDATAWASNFNFFTPESMEGNYSFFSDLMDQFKRLPYHKILVSLINLQLQSLLMFALVGI